MGGKNTFSNKALSIYCIDPEIMFFGNVYQKLPLSIRRQIKYKKQLLKRNIKKPIRRLSEIPLVESILYTKAQPKLSPFEKNIVAEIERIGYATANVSDFSMSLTKPMLDTMVRKSGKKYLHTLPLPPELPVLAESFLPIVEGYLGLASKAAFVLFELTEVAQAERVQSQHWHRDHERYKMLKIFVYYGDVDEDAGPFEYIGFSRTKFKHFYPQTLTGGSYPPVGEMGELLPFVKTFTGKAGTIIFADTSGFHRGGFAREKERVMATIVYTLQ